MKGRGAFLNELFYKLERAEEKRLEIVKKYGGKFHPIIVVYRNKKRVYSIILNK